MLFLRDGESLRERILSRRLVLLRCFSDHEPKHALAKIPGPLHLVGALRVALAAELE